jgi:4-hydroxybenzoate polyprenyltransferase
VVGGRCQVRHRTTPPSYRLHMLPKTLGPDDLRNIAIAVLVVLLLVAFLVMRFIQKMVLRVILIGALVGFGAYVYYQRDTLKDCAKDNSCEFFGYKVQVPEG